MPCNASAPWAHPIDRRHRASGLKMSREARWRAHPGRRACYGRPGNRGSLFFQMVSQGLLRGNEHASR